MVEDHRRAVEDELVLAADEIDIGERAGGVGRPRREHALPLGEHTGSVRRGVHRHDQLGSALARPADRAGRAPGVLADGDADPDAGDEEQAGRVLCPGRSSAARRTRRSSAAAACGRSRAPVRRRRPRRRCTGRRPPRRSRRPRHSAAVAAATFSRAAEVAGDEAGLDQQILGRIAGQRRARGTRPGRLPPPRPAPSAARTRSALPLEVADDDVELAQGDPQCAHVESLPGARPATATVRSVQSAGAGGTSRSRLTGSLPPEDSLDRCQRPSCSTSSPVRLRHPRRCGW